MWITQTTFMKALKQQMHNVYHFESLLNFKIYIQKRSYNYKIQCELMCLDKIICPIVFDMDLLLKALEGKPKEFLRRWYAFFSCSAGIRVCIWTINLNELLYDPFC